MIMNNKVDFYIDCHKDQLEGILEKLEKLRESESSLKLVSKNFDGDSIYLSLNGTWNAYKEFASLKEFSIYHYED